VKYCGSTALIAARLRPAALGDLGVKIRLAAIGYGWTVCGDPRSANVCTPAGDVVAGIAWLVDRGVVAPEAWWTNAADGDPCDPGLPYWAASIAD
jgi:hypothetical protein